MPNYYEYLQVEPAASIQQIQIAIDDRYNQCRRLVTHHDPTVVNQASMALQSLEKIREVLLDPERRAVYDDALGLSGNLIGGLGDPQSAAVGGPAMVPPAVKSNQPSRAASVSAAPAEGWHCDKCNSISQVGSFFCKSCGNEIGQSCPKCNTLFEKTAKFCPSCGVNPREFAAEQEKLQVEALEKQRQGIRQKLNEADMQLAAGMYGLAKDALGVFEGLGNAKASNPVICRRTEPEWKEAEVLNQNANTMRMAFIRQNVLKITVGYAAVAGGLGFIRGIILLIGQISDAVQYQYAFNWTSVIAPFLSLLGWGIGGAIAGAVGSGIYFYQWGGRRQISQDLLFGAAAPIGLTFMLALGPTCFGAVIFLLALWFGLAVLGLGSNRRS